MKKYLYTVATITAITFISCDKDDPTTPVLENEREVITTVKLDFVKNGDTTSFQFRDLDGEGGQSGSVDTIFLQSNVEYSTSLTLLDESKNPVVDISSAIRAEANEHIVCYAASGVNVDVVTIDKDGNNMALGLSTLWDIEEAGRGTVTVTLKHQPGSKNGTCTPGETDVEVVFPVVIRN